MGFRVETKRRQITLPFRKPPSCFTYPYCHIDSSNAFGYGMLPALSRFTSGPPPLSPPNPQAWRKPELPPSAPRDDSTRDRRDDRGGGGGETEFRSGPARGWEDSRGRGWEDSRGGPARGWEEPRGWDRSDRRSRSRCLSPRTTLALSAAPDVDQFRPAPARLYPRA